MCILLVGISYFIINPSDADKDNAKLIFLEKQGYLLDRNDGSLYRDAKRTFDNDYTIRVSNGSRSFQKIREECLSAESQPNMTYEEASKRLSRFLPHAGSILFKFKCIDDYMFGTRIVFYYLDESTVFIDISHS